MKFGKIKDGWSVGARIQDIFVVLFVAVLVVVVLPKFFVFVPRKIGQWKFCSKLMIWDWNQFYIYFQFGFLFKIEKKEI